MSLFAGLFSAAASTGGKQEAGLFSTSNQYLSTEPKEQSKPSTLANGVGQPSAARSAREAAQKSGKPSKKQKQPRHEVGHAVEQQQQEQQRKNKKPSKGQPTGEQVRQPAPPAPAAGAPAAQQRQQTKGSKKNTADGAAQAATAAAAGKQQQQQRQVGRKRKAAAEEAQVVADDEDEDDEKEEEEEDSEQDAASDDMDAEQQQNGQEATAAGVAAERKRTPEQEAERISRTVFVGNLPSSMTAKGLKKLFSQFGSIESTRLRSVALDPNSKLPRRAAVIMGKVDRSRAPAAGYVVFVEKAAVDKALQLNMTEVDGHHIQVDRAAQPAKAAKAAAAAGGAAAAANSIEYDPGRSLFCGNLHFQATNEEVIQFFTRPEALEGNPELQPGAHGGKPAVEAVRVVRDPATSLGKGFAFVMFRTKAAVRAALSLNGHLLRNRPVRLTRVSQQQQARVKRARDAAQAGPPAKKARHSPAAGDKGGARRAPRVNTADAGQWQGTRTKGKGKGVRGLKLDGPRGSRGTGALGVKAKGASSKGKRPAVAARKQQQRLQNAKQKAQG